MTDQTKQDLARGFASRSIHAGYEPDSHLGSINVPIYASTTFAQDGLAELRGGFEYGRVANPTVRALENTLASLEGAAYARVFSSGMAAIDTLVRILVRPGDHVILGNDCYGGTYRLLQDDFGEWGVELSIVDTTDPQAVVAAIRDNTKVIWLETPTNPRTTWCTRPPSTWAGTRTSSAARWSPTTRVSMTAWPTSKAVSARWPRRSMPI